ncbi:MAG: recombination mediator RecR [Candidatus Zambryskibacteria bacterium]|nr:recombination mediator RecR [Candidatus Zambryskibacteria bacterium]
MNSIDKLSEMFSKFPGIGPRQAKRFVYYLLSRNGTYTQELIQAIQNLKKEISQCSECQRYFVSLGKDSPCSICADDTRDTSMLMVVPRDVDLEAVEKSGTYKGYYFVLGGVVPILEKEPEKKVRINKLQGIINNRKDLKEIILAMNANQDGEHTTEYVKEQCQGPSLTFSVLGRGLSTGAELEYADPETLKNAFLHRTK